MAIDQELLKTLKQDVPEKQFVPYSYLSKEADALTVYFEGDPDYSERLSDHVTLYRSIKTKELVGCRIKGISGLLEDLPNFIHVSHDGVELRAVFLPFWGNLDREQRKVLSGLAKSADDHGMVLESAI